MDEAIAAVTDMLSGNAFGAAGSRVVIEEFLSGEEASFLAFTDGKNIIPLASAQDHKAVFDGDRGPNTGGMGAYSPAPVVTPAIHEKAMAEVMRPHRGRHGGRRASVPRRPLRRADDQTAERSRRSNSMPASAIRNASRC